MWKAERRIHFNQPCLSKSYKQGAKHAVFQFAAEVWRRSSSSPNGMKNNEELKWGEQGTLQKKKKDLILPASGQKHGFLDEDGARQQDVPATPNVIGAEREESSDGYKAQWFRTLLKSKALLDLCAKQGFHQLRLNMSWEHIWKSRPRAGQWGVISPLSLHVCWLGSKAVAAQRLLLVPSRDRCIFIYFFYYYYLKRQTTRDERGRDGRERVRRPVSEPTSRVSSSHTHGTGRNAPMRKLGIADELNSVWPQHDAAGCHSVSPHGRQTSGTKKNPRTSGRRVKVADASFGLSLNTAAVTSRSQASLRNIKVASEEVLHSNKQLAA